MRCNAMLDLDVQAERREEVEKSWRTMLVKSEEVDGSSIRIH